MIVPVEARQQRLTCTFSPFDHSLDDVGIHLQIQSTFPVGVADMHNAIAISRDGHLQIVAPVLHDIQNSADKTKNAVALKMIPSWQQATFISLR